MIGVMKNNRIRSAGRVCQFKGILGKTTRWRSDLKGGGRHIDNDGRIE